MFRKNRRREATAVQTTFATKSTLLRHSGRLRIRQPSETLAPALGSARGTRQGRCRRSKGNTDLGPVDRASRGTGLQRLRRMPGRVRATPGRLFADGV